MDEQDLHLWVNLLRNFEAKIQPLIHLILTTVRVLYGYQKELMVGGQGVHRITGEVRGSEEIQ